MGWFDLVLLILASFRLTHLIVYDSITEPLRRSLTKDPFFSELITCYWCCGIWVSALLALCTYQWPVLGRPLLLVLAVAAGQALIEKQVQSK